jgi:uncharacterized membrane protein YgcG
LLGRSLFAGASPDDKQAVHSGLVKASTCVPFWTALVLLTLMEAWLIGAFPGHSGYVNDFAGVLDQPARANIERLLRATERDTSAEIALGTVGSLEGMTIEEYANRLFKEWGIGTMHDARDPIKGHFTELCCCTVL